MAPKHKFTRLKKTTMKKFLIIPALLLFACTATTVKTNHFSFDGTKACITDTVIATVDSTGAITHIHSPSINIAMQKDSAGHVITILNACIDVNK
jgi:hypothetical protein